jgi:hypothetical protein
VSHTPRRPISAFQDQFSILIVGYMITRFASKIFIYVKVVKIYFVNNLIFANSKMSENNDFVTPKASNMFQIQA